MLHLNVDAADDVSLSVNCNTLKLKRGGEATCEINASVLTTTFNDHNANLEFSYDSDLSITNASGDYFDGSISNNRLSLTNALQNVGNYELGTIKVKVASDASYGNQNITFKFLYENAAVGSYEAASITKTIAVLSEDNNLESITINNEKLTNFDAKVLNYRFETEEEKITIGAKASAGSIATIEGLGEKTLKTGENVYEIKVTSQAGTIKTYTLTIIKQDERSNVNTLKTLTIEGIKFNFKSETTSYKINVESDVTKIKITSTLTDNKSSYVTNFGNREVDLAYGKNIVLVKVKSEKGEVRTYTLTINREDDRSDIAKLTSLTINGSTVSLKDDVYEYNLTLHHKHTKTEVVAKANSQATVKYEDIKLEVGDNELIIKVISEKGTEKQYKITIKRLTLEESQVSLENIVISGYNLNFTKDVKIYNLKIAKDVTTLDISVLPKDNAVIYSVLGNNDLKNGSVITINVRDDIGEYVYTINISKDVEEELILGLLTIEQVCYIIFSIGVLSFLCSIIYALKNKKVK